MPVCQVCREYLHSDYCIVVNEEKNHCKCVFCELMKDEITIQDDNLKKEYKVTKKEVVENYKRYINDLYYSKRVQDLVKPKDKSNIIKPY